MRITVDIDAKMLQEMMKITGEKAKGRAVAMLAEESFKLKKRRKLLLEMIEKGKGIEFAEYDPWRFERAL